MVPVLGVVIFVSVVAMLLLFSVSLVGSASSDSTFGRLSAILVPYTGSAIVRTSGTPLYVCPLMFLMSLPS